MRDYKKLDVWKIGREINKINYLKNEGDKIK